MKKIVVIGSSNMDMVVTAAHFPKPGETVMGSNFMTNFGGKGANQAVAAARLGGDVTFICRVGDDSHGEQMSSHFMSEGIDVSCVITTKGVPTGMALITVNGDGENNIVVVSGANGCLTPADIDTSINAIDVADIILMQLETPVDALTYAAAKAHERGKYVVLNPAPAPSSPLPQELLDCVDLIIPNETEASIITGIEITDEASAASALQRLKELGVPDAMITLGSRGVMYLDSDKVKVLPACKVKAVDTTAAGDTFCGAICVALANGKTKDEAIAFANKASAYTVQHHGAQCAMPTLQDMETESSNQPVLNEHNKEEYAPAHTAEHLLNQTMVRMFGCERSKNAHIERKKSKINYNLASCPTAEQIAEIERRMNELIAQDLPVTFEFVDRNHVPEGVKLDKLPDNASEMLRIVRIGDYDICPCVGNHVASTKEIGNFKITSTSYTDGSFRIVYRVNIQNN